MHKLEIKIGNDEPITIPIALFNVERVLTGDKSIAYLPVQCESHSVVHIRNDNGSWFSVRIARWCSDTRLYELQTVCPKRNIKRTHLEVTTKNHNYIHGLHWDHVGLNVLSTNNLISLGNMARYYITKHEHGWMAEYFVGQLADVAVERIGIFENIRTAQFYCYCDYRIRLNKNEHS